MVFTASPVGDNFRIRSQRFLATINSTVIDWFQAWPEASLLSVANKFLADVDLGEDAVRGCWDMRISMNYVIRIIPMNFDWYCIPT